jgi:hypothetical protein
MNDTQQPANSSATGTTFTGLSDEERAAMKQRTQELKAEARRGPRADKADAERDVLHKIAEMPQPDSTLLDNRRRRSGYGTNSSAADHCAVLAGDR